MGLNGPGTKEEPSTIGIDGKGFGMGWEGHTHTIHLTRRAVVPKSNGVILGHWAGIQKYNSF